MELGSKPTQAHSNTSANSDDPSPADSDNSENANSSEPAMEEAETPQELTTATPEDDTIEPSSNPPELRRSTRVRHHPDRYGH